MKNTFVIYNSLYAESVCSTAIVIKKNPSATLVDLHKVAASKIKSHLAKALGKDFEEIYLFVDNVKDLLPKSKRKPTLNYSPKGKKIDGHYNKRVVLLWKKLFPAATIPQCVHHVSGLQLAPENIEKGEFFKLAIVANLSKLVGENGFYTKQTQAWLNMMSRDGDIDFLRTMCSTGASIDAYIKKTGVKTPKAPAAPKKKK